MTGVSRQALGDCIFLPAPPFKERRFIPGMQWPGLSRSAFCKRACCRFGAAAPKRQHALD